MTDAAVREYAALLRAGGKLANLFPRPLSECAFTDDQRDVIRQARHERAAQIKKFKDSVPKVPIVAQQKSSLSDNEFRGGAKPFTKLRKLLYLQEGRCFFCGEELTEDKASIEHLLARKWGGKSEEWNEVVCHKSLNAAFGAMDLRSKFQFVIRSAGKLRCP